MDGSQFLVDSTYSTPSPERFTPLAQIRRPNGSMISIIQYSHVLGVSPFKSASLWYQITCQEFLDNRVNEVHRNCIEATHLRSPATDELLKDYFNFVLFFTKKIGILAEWLIRTFILTDTSRRSI